jgi:hypothetical protein
MGVINIMVETGQLVETQFWEGMAAEVDLQAVLDHTETTQTQQHKQEMEEQLQEVAMAEMDPMAMAMATPELSLVVAVAVPLEVVPALVWEVMVQEARFA